MKPTIMTLDTLMLGAWVANGHAAIVGAVRRLDNSVEPCVIEAYGPAWAALAEALDEAVFIGVRHVLIATNDIDLLAALRRKPTAYRHGMRIMVGLTPPTPTEQRRVFLNRDMGSINVKFGGDAAHWHVLQRLGMDFGGNCAIIQSDNLPKARELWQSRQ